MKVKFDICPSPYKFFSRNDMGFAMVKFKGCIESDKDISYILKVRGISMTSCMTMAEYVNFDIKKEFDFELKLPCGSNYRIVFEIVRKDNEEWIEYINNFNHISVGDVFVIAGQSNAVGYGRGFYENILDHRIHNYRLSGEWALASHPLNTLEGYNGNVLRDSGEYSPHITMAKKIMAHTAVPIAFIPCAVGGTSIHRWNKRYEGDLYTDMIRRIKESETEISGVIWCQGSADAVEERSSDYFKILKEFIEDTRKELNKENLKFFIYQINRCTLPYEKNDEYWCRVREGQRKVAFEDENVYAVSSYGAALMEDGIHNSPAGCDLIGERMAAAILDKVYNMPVSANVPMAEKAVLKSENEIEVLFNKETVFVSDNVNNRKYDFKIADSLGDAEITEIKLIKNKAVLKTSRSINKDITVYCGYGCNPKYEIPYDMMSGIPALSFMLNI